MHKRWIPFVLVVIIIALGVHVYQVHQKMARLEMELGTIWSNEFSQTVLSGILATYEDLTKWSRADSVSATDLGYMRRRIGNIEAVPGWNNGFPDGLGKCTFSEPSLRTAGYG